jgi:hypothetical protein
MVTLAIGGAIVLLLAGVIGLFVWLDRRDRRHNEQWEENHLRDMNEYARELGAESDDQRSLAADFAKRSWAEVRAICESVHGKPCECATKERAANHVWWTLARRQNRRSGEAVVRDFAPPLVNQPPLQSIDEGERR